MMTYHSQSETPKEQLLVLGIGGSGSNVLGALARCAPARCDLCSVQTDSRLDSTQGQIRQVRIGEQLTRGLGCGGDPELGARAAAESIEDLKKLVSGRKVVLICAGLGGGTGSGSAPVLARLAREAGAFVAVFATLPFPFEGRRRETQARESLDHLEIYANAMIVFENVRMGELPEAGGGVYAAFSAADDMISRAICSVARIATNPGLIHLGLDDVTAVLRGTRSRVLFGTGTSRGQLRAENAMKAALQCPLLDRGRLLKEARELIVHIMGGPSLGLQEIELIMSELGKSVAPGAQLHFGAAIEDTLGEDLTVTLISSLPEDEIWGESRGESASTAAPRKDTKPAPASAPAPTSSPVTQHVAAAHTAPVTQAAPVSQAAPVAPISAPEAVPAAAPASEPAASTPAAPVSHHPVNPAPVAQADSHLPTSAPASHPVEVPAAASHITAAHAAAHTAAQPATPPTLPAAAAAVEAARKLSAERQASAEAARAFAARHAAESPLPPIPAPVASPAPIPQANPAQHPQAPPAPQPQAVNSPAQFFTPQSSSGVTSPFSQPKAPEEHDKSEKFDIFSQEATRNPFPIADDDDEINIPSSLPGSR